MATKLYESGFDHAKQLILQRQVTVDGRNAWSVHQPSPQRENDFIEEHGWAEYGKWHLGLDDKEPEDKKAHYKFPYGDFKKVHRCAILSAESRAGQYNDFDIELACAHLHGMIDLRQGV